MTPHTIRWIPSTQTFNSITICPMSARFVCKIFLVFIFGVVLLPLLLSLLLHAVLQPPRHTTTTLSMYDLLVFVFSYSFAVFNPNHQRPKNKNKLLNVVFFPFKVLTASRFGLCCVYNTCWLPQWISRLSWFICYRHFGRLNSWRFVVKICAPTARFYALLAKCREYTKLSNGQKKKRKEKPIIIFIKRK